MNDMQQLSESLAEESHFIDGCVQSAMTQELKEKAKQLCHDAIGDPNALDRNGEPRWKWYLVKARGGIAKATGAAS